MLFALISNELCHKLRFRWKLLCRHSTMSYKWNKWLTQIFIVASTVIDLFSIMKIPWAFWKWEVEHRLENKSHALSSKKSFVKRKLQTLSRRLLIPLMIWFDYVPDRRKWRIFGVELFKRMAASFPLKSIFFHRIYADSLELCRKTFMKSPITRRFSESRQIEIDCEFFCF